MSKPFRSTVPAAIVAAAACALGLAQAPQESGATLRERIERLRGEGEAAEAEMASLPQLGEEAALAALDGLASAGPLERRRRAHLVFLAGGGRAIEPAIAALGDPDPATRGELLGFLGRDDLGASGLDARVAALADRALADPDRSLRAGAIERLAALDRPESLARLDSILDGIEAGLRARAAALLADRPLARDAVERRVRAGRASGPEVLGPMLLAYGRILAERGDFASAAPILAAREDPDPTVRRGARLGIDELMRRTMSGGDAARAAAAVRELEALGLDPADGALFRVRIALELGDDPAPALEAARELLAGIGRSAPASGSEGDRASRLPRSSRATARLLEASARVAADELEEARSSLAEAENLLDGLLAERLDRASASLAREHAEWLHRRAQCELLAIVRELAAARHEDGEPWPDDLLAALPPEATAACVAAARKLHGLELEAQLATTLAGSRAPQNLDPLLEDELSAGPLLLENPRLRAWPAPRALAVRFAIGKLLASVARDEMPGFEPLPGIEPTVADPLEDPARLDRLRRILAARQDEVSRDFLDLRERVRREMAGDPAAPSDAEAEQLQVLNRDWLDLLDANQRAGKGETRALLESRGPSLHGMTLVRAFREEGSAARARALALAVKADLERSGDLKRYWLIEADIEMAIGSTWIDDDDPARAEVEITRAVERLETIEDALRERGASPRDLAAVRGLRSSALVSLAVNANVKMGDPVRATAYFERAFELRQDEFMRVLLACYRARSGRGEEARAILRQISPSPANLYNVACTWALLGERDLALDCLARNLAETPMSAGAREKQKEWARKDPDLESLRGDPRFRALVGP